ncbi:MIC complex subunit mic10-like protein [Elsinoe fawcettii]|nr:MIC complex subunit mic10-like protein [Elsinoe fawcettii]
MADSKGTPPPTTPVAPRSSRPLSEGLLNEKWDHCLSTLLIRSTLGASFGVIFSVLLFKRRAWPAFVGLGFGAGRAWEECDSSFKRAAGPTRGGLGVLR